MNILGISYPCHDTGAALIVNGSIRCAIEEERLNRIKHTAAAPYRAIDWCLAEAGLEMGDIDSIILPYHRNLSRDFLSMATNFLFELPGSLQSFRHRGANFIRENHNLDSLAQRLRSNGYTGTVEKLDHHLAHAAGAFFTSPYEHAAILTLDGVGEWTTGWVGIGKGNRLCELQRFSFPDSLGYVYMAFTHHLGFKVNGEEGTVMALAAYGNHENLSATGLADELIHLTGTGFTINRELFRYQQGGKNYFSSRVLGKLGPPRATGEELTQHHMDIAALAQEVTRRTVSHLLSIVHARTGCNNICLGGGVALNSVINGQINRTSPFTDSYISPVPSDAGLALGAALHKHHFSSPNDPHRINFTPFLGPEFDSGDIPELAGGRPGLICKRPPDLPAVIAQNIADGKIVAIARERLELGPRALGNRSLLADPRNPDMRARLNRIKERQWFRPVAGAVLLDAASDYFIGSTPSPYMEKVYPVAIKKRSLIPSAIHQDGTCRIQSVPPQGFFADILKEFEQLTGIPVLLNTSLNGPGQPLINSCPDAVEFLCATDTDLLVAGDYLISKTADRI